MIAQLVKHRRFVAANAWTETRHRYAGTAMGAFWHIIQPLMLIVLFAFIFSGLFPARPAAAGQAGTLIYIMSGMLPWLAFADCMARCTTSLTDNAHYLRKISLPEILFVARTGVTAGIMMALSLGLTLAAAVLSGVTPSWSWLTMPAAAALFVAFGFGLGLILSPVHVFLRDTGQAVGVLTQFWMWMTPVVMVEDMLPPALRQFQTVNPAYWFIRAIREPLMTGQAAAPAVWVIMLALVAGSIWIGQRLLDRARSEVRDML
jgi:lipopolysaccharide transport system permease protein